MQIAMCPVFHNKGGCHLDLFFQGTLITAWSFKGHQKFTLNKIFREYIFKDERVGCSKNAILQFQYFQGLVKVHKIFENLYTWK